ncbi:MAG: TspO/MBR family protein [Puniceicoccaceae bacterium]
MKSLRRLLTAMLAPQLASLIGASVTLSGDGSWYATLEKPIFNPPSWVFGPVWTVLYVFMGVASYLVWRNSTSPWYSRTMTWYWMQLTLNAMWSPAFFGLQSPLLGLIVIVPLCVLVGICVYAFWLRSTIASLLMLPYGLWLCYATVLNASIFWLNR